MCLTRRVCSARRVCHGMRDLDGTGCWVVDVAVCVASVYVLACVTGWFDVPMRRTLPHLAYDVCHGIHDSNARVAGWQNVGVCVALCMSRHARLIEWTSCINNKRRYPPARVCRDIREKTNTAVTAVSNRRY